MVKARFCKPTGQATPLPIGGIKLFCKLYCNMRNALKENNFTKRMAG